MVVEIGVRLVLHVGMHDKSYNLNINELHQTNDIPQSLHTQRCLQGNMRVSRVSLMHTTHTTFSSV